MRSALLLAAAVVTGCGGTSAADPASSPGGAGGSGGSGATGGSEIEGGQWTGGGGGTSAAGAPATGGSAGAAQTKPYYLPDGRTYDQDTDYIEWQGQVAFVQLTHKDGTSLPASEGGTSCSAGCDEQVTRIDSGASVWGRFKGITGINVQLASTGESGHGQGVLSICGTDLPAFDLTGTSGLAGFNNLPSPAHTVAPTDDCEWRVKAVGGHVYFRAVTVSVQ